MLAQCINTIRAQAHNEWAEEKRREMIERQKLRLRAQRRRPWWHRWFPWVLVRRPGC